MKEEFLYLIWQLKKFDLSNLSTSEGKALELINFGFRNQHSGPDFSNGRIKLDGMEWAGNIEMHIKSSDWDLHGHQNDPAYNNVILHVVYEHDKEVQNNNGERISVLELKNRIPIEVFQKLSSWFEPEKEILCSDSFESFNDLLRASVIDKMLVERFEKRADQFKETLRYNNNDWEEAFYQSICRNFGFKVNALPMELLARSTPLKFLQKNVNNPFIVEAILLGQSGLISGSDLYPHQLLKEYTYQKKLLGLMGLKPSIWKFGRMRPHNFPTIRIAQFANFISQHPKMFASVIACTSLEELLSFFKNFEAHPFWKRHYTFKNEVEEKSCRLGKGSIDLLLINTVLPYIFLYGVERQEEQFKNRAISWLYEIKAEKNTIIKKWDKLNWKSNCAAETQAKIHLFNHYCQSKKCLSCAFGVSLFKND
jgi:hypothetical protein